MMNSKWALAMLILLVLAYPALSQNGGFNLPNFTVHSPNVASLGKYGEYPVDMSTGVPMISIPLHTIKGHKLQAGISASYHASGIKLDQDASFIGLGWVLHSGGVITRMVRGKPDENNGFLQIGGTLPTYNSIEDLQGAGNIGTSALLKELFPKDLEPDLFTLSVEGLSDEFCLNNAGQFVSINQEPLVYQVDLYNHLIIVKDKVGNTYRFGKALDGTLAVEIPNVAHDFTNTANGFPGAPSNILDNYPTAWYLTEIISADQSETISFKYRNGFYTDGRATGVTRYILQDYITEPVADRTGLIFDGTIYSYAQTTLTNQQWEAA